MRKVREILRLRLECGRTMREIAVSCAVGPATVSDYLARAQAAGLTWAQAVTLSERGGRSAAVSRGGSERAVGASADRLRVGASRASADGRDAAASLGGVPGGRRSHGHDATSSVPVQPVLRPVRVVAAEARGLDAPGASRRREGLRRLLGQEARYRRPAHRRGDGGRALRRGARREQLHLRGGDADAEARRLRRVDDARLRILRRACRKCSCPTNCAAPSAGRIGTSRTSTRRISRWRSTTASRSSRRGLASRATRPRSKAGSCSRSDGSSPRLRNRSLLRPRELNAAIAELLEELNERPFKKLEGCRRSTFESVDRPAMKRAAGASLRDGRMGKSARQRRLPRRLRRAALQRAVALVGERVEIRATATTVEILHGGERVASHARSYGRKGTRDDLRRAPAAGAPRLRPVAARTHGRVGGELSGRTWRASSRCILARNPRPESGYRAVPRR